CDSKWRVERATGETALSAASASGGVYREPQYQRYGFTMAEILLSLTIIGVVSAITLPSLTGNINERTWNTQRKALYARFSQAIALMPSLNGYGTLDDTTDNAAETFITSGLSKVLKINNICDNDHIADCGIASKFTDFTGSQKTIPTTVYGLNSKFNYNFNETDGTPNGYSQIDTKAVAFESANGESILTFYNPQCNTGFETNPLKNFAQIKMCINFIYDLNGSKGPNTVGKDIGIITVLYPTDSVVVAPMPFNKNFASITQHNASKQCRNLDSEARLPNLEEFAAIFYNKDILGNLSQEQGQDFWTSTLSENTAKAKAFDMNSGRIYNLDRTNPYNVICVKR
ncbi:MAG: type II secretion system GspH family protein, partial [Fusobacterium sp.]|nr:type II secretion system GspH family protein [Fusobacterium sp.]